MLDINAIIERFVMEMPESPPTGEEADDGMVELIADGLQGVLENPPDPNGPSVADIVVRMAYSGD